MVCSGVVYNSPWLRIAAPQLSQLLLSHQLPQSTANAIQECNQQETRLSFVVLLELRVVQVQLAPILSPVIWVIFPLAAPLLPKVPL